MAMTINEARLNKLIGQAIVDFGATFNAALIVLGDQLRALADGGPLTAGELAARTETAERYVREWLNAQAASGYIAYHPETSRYQLSPEQAMLFADEHSSVFFVGAFQSALAATRIGPKLETAFRSGEGIGWHEHDHTLFHGTERFFRPGYATNLTSSWLPALDGVVAKLEARRWPISAAATAPRPSSWHRPIPARPLQASTTTRSQSPSRASAPQPPAWLAGCASSQPQPARTPWQLRPRHHL
jgi:hypothetical protein